MGGMRKYLHRQNEDSGNDSYCDAFGPNNYSTSRAVLCSTPSSESASKIEKIKIIQKKYEQQIKELPKLNMKLQRDAININEASVEKIEKMISGGSSNRGNVEIGAVVDDEVKFCLSPCQGKRMHVSEN
ncbi:hypothetical protein JTB14_026975 [Gonioctena quinquepunctata]|nr:hypothetical protein JTB14_026975 [Gonioctena quinquepunctata]